MASVSLFTLAACGSGNKQVTAGGSTALQPMVEHASMSYMKQNPDEIIMVQGAVLVLAWLKLLLVLFKLVILIFLPKKSQE